MSSYAVIMKYIRNSNYEGRSESKGTFNSSQTYFCQHFKNMADVINMIPDAFNPHRYNLYTFMTLSSWPRLGEWCVPCEGDIYEGAVLYYTSRALCLAKGLQMWIARKQICIIDFLNVRMGHVCICNRSRIIFSHFRGGKFPAKWVELLDTVVSTM